MVIDVVRTADLTMATAIAAAQSEGLIRRSPPGPAAGRA
jgi:hypothetical protein